MEELQKIYDAIVGVTMVNIYTLSKDKEAINFNNFDIDNEEHLYLLSVAMISNGIIGKPIRFNLPIWKRKRIAKMFGNPTSIQWKKRAKKNESFDTSDVLDFIRQYAVIESGDELFMFDEIYQCYYKKEQR